ncbi:unnamed protein product [Rotaria sp. Silwood1]|nr:unnamed protein product [Rotaria sp. Silwood1]CAF3644181.1 unnamed protein product [Rotaria sp. Silwood1]CAF3663994.1 unnamed protein product [Rotaria sp. Silwood1]CAF3712679.1 unnamed protein product [Rotaria sp. Silwood1]CAF4555413.1 unnamed protein product [Rotaria sp. Silwood1]
MMRENALWAKKWNDQKMQDKIKSASGVVMALDKTNNSPCGFGRIFIVSTTEEYEAKFAYLTDITIASEYQNKGLGFALTNTLLGMFIDGNSKRCAHGSICLFCSDEGVGAIAAPKLYRKSGFEFFDKTDKRMALIHTDQFHGHSSS